MKRKTIIAAVIAAIMALGVFTVFALDYAVPENATHLTARFFLTEPDGSGETFSMTSEDDELLIHITDNTLIYFEDYVPLSDECDEMTRIVREVLFGRTLAEVLDGRMLRVTFEDSEQINPISIEVLFETFVTLPEPIHPGDLTDNGYMGIMPLPESIDSEYEARRTIDALTLNGEVVVNNEILEGAPTPVIEGGAIMVPLRVVAEALGYDVSWNEYLQSVQLGVAIQLWIGNTEVHLGRMAPIELGAAPTLIDGVTFVPIEFFREVLGQTAYVFEGQVVIETYSDMM